MSGPVRISFEQTIVELPMTAILPRKIIAEAQKKTVKYKRIASSISEVGIVEPIVISRLEEDEDKFMLLDGHIRFTIALDRGATTIRCLIANDDEGFTYNKRVNRLATVQEHYMLIKALNSGVPEEKLAKTFDLDISMIKRRRTLLDGICPEVIELLKDKSVNPVTFDVLRKMRPMRQIESAELMLTVHNWTSSYAKALLAATKQEDLAKPDRPKKIGGLTREQMARMEREMASLHQDFKQIEESYGDDILHLVVASGYLSKLVGNSEIERFLTQRYPEFLDEFRAIIVASSLDQTGLTAS
ncbi:plasmid partitioning protein RepB C-terminal domain-containing protein [Agrobacterium tumefaciens]|uniref:plasmid partitioning protein RepB C-terminal domain-containing protein n=1 Tax=Agrobacterium tumefaciens TaxID=358 RepID=UPI000DD02169|nr:plasmid partitioning protein RepB C-terminal domain-containing protein [Agrobacterium tumefaciens]AYM08978.1 chromosome partitioning protein, ParB family [Agrobacterium tumefaciens]NSZ35776.1 ParB N-terminal domain-containing protein [Agrobacterium tumefaciens]QLG25419.1 ParB N-terminal domain-containing protein [Agrobacterium tumefaciens]UXS89293.1 ParB N-terminal domain-containing protein [Agrobacterium tumefaciens]